MKFFSNLFAGLGLFAVLAWIGLICAAVYGYVANLLIVVGSAGAPLSEFTLMLVLRILGIFAFPLGALLGFF